MSSKEGIQTGQLTKRIFVLGDTGTKDLTGVPYNTFTTFAEISAKVDFRAKGGSGAANEIETTGHKETGITNVVFTVASSVLYENGTVLTTDQVKVTNLQFISFGDGYKIEMTVEYNNLDNRSEYNASVDLETTTLSRQ